MGSREAHDSFLVTLLGLFNKCLLLSYSLHMYYTYFEVLNIMYTGIYKI